MAKKKLVWTLRAINDKIEIYQYWNLKNKSKDYSSKLDSLFSKSALILCEFPNSGILADFEAVRVKTIRGYQLFYKLVNESLVILTIWDSRRNPKGLKV